MPRTETGLARYHDGEEVTASDIDAIEDQAAAMERERLRTNFKVGWDAMTPAERSHLRVYGIDRLVAKLLADPTP